MDIAKDPADHIQPGAHANPQSARLSDSVHPIVSSSTTADSTHPASVPASAPLTTTGSGPSPATPLVLGQGQGSGESQGQGQGTSATLSDADDSGTAISTSSGRQAGTAGVSSATAPVAPVASSPLSSTPRAGSSVTPTIKLTPATPDTTHFASNITNTASSSSSSSPPPPPASSASAPAPATPNMAGPSDPTTGGVSASTTASIPKTTPPSTATGAGPSTTTTARAPGTAAPGAKGTKPKRKRTGFNKFLAAFGCLSAHELEDDPATVKKREEAARRKEKEQEQEKARDKEKEREKAAAAAPAAPSTSTAAPLTVNKTADAAAVDTTATTGPAGAGAGTGAAAIPVQGVEEDKSNEKGQVGEVVVPPSEPTSPPLAETAGLTSGAVQPPGSGSELLNHTPSKRRDSASSVEASPTAAVSSRTTGVGAGAAAGAGAGIGAGAVLAGAAGTETLQHEHADSRQADDRDEYDDANEHEHDNEEDSEGDDGDADLDHEYSLQDEYEEEDRLIAQGGLGIPTDEHGNPAPLLPPIDKAHIGRKCLVLDLDETLLHSSFKLLPSADYIVPVEIESQVHNVYVIKRPGVDKFLTEMGRIYEIVVFTASLSKYADPVLDMLDPNGVVKHRLFRESCYNHKGNYVKDLSQLGRTMETSIIIDNSPASYIFHPNNAVPVSTWFNDPHDTELMDLCPFLADLAEVDDIRGVLDGTV